MQQMHFNRIESKKITLSVRKQKNLSTNVIKLYNQIYCFKTLQRLPKYTSPKKIEIDKTTPA